MSMIVPTEVIEARRELEFRLRAIIDHQERISGGITRDPIGRVWQMLPEIITARELHQRRIAIVADEIGTNITHIMLKA